MHFMALRREAQTEINVLEAIPKRLVKPALLQEQAAANHQASGGHYLEAPRAADGRMIARESLVEMARVPVLADHHAGMLDRAVRIEQLAPHHGSAWPLARVPNQLGQPTRPWHHVVVEEQQPITGGHFGTGVAGRRETLVLLQPHETNAIPQVAQRLG